MFLLFFVYFGCGEKRDQICVCQSHYNDPWILMASFSIDNYRRWHTSRAGVDGEKTRGKMLAANDIQHAEHVLCMMTTGNFNEAFVFFLPESQCGLGSGRNEQISACLYSATDYSSATFFEYAILRLKDKKNTLETAKGN